MLHQQLCKISDQGAIAVFTVGAVVTLVMYFSASLIMLLREDKSDEDSVDGISSRMFSKGALFVMFACAGLGGLIMVYALAWYLKASGEISEDETSMLEMVPEIEFEDSHSQELIPAAKPAPANHAIYPQANHATPPVVPTVTDRPDKIALETSEPENPLRIPFSESFN